MATVENNAATMQDATNATNKATVRNNAATLQDAIMQPAKQQSGMTKLRGKMQQTLATVGNNAATMQPTKATVRNNAATIHDATNAPQQ